MAWKQHILFETSFSSDILVLFTEFQCQVTDTFCSTSRFVTWIPHGLLLSKLDKFSFIVISEINSSYRYIKEIFYRFNSFGCYFHGLTNMIIFTLILDPGPTSIVFLTPLFVVHKHLKHFTEIMTHLNRISLT